MDLAQRQRHSPSVPLSTALSTQNDWCLYYILRHSWMNIHAPLTSLCFLGKQKYLRWAVLFARSLRLRSKISFAHRLQNRPGVAGCALMHEGSEQRRKTRMVETFQHFAEEYRSKPSKQNFWFNKHSVFSIFFVMSGLFFILQNYSKHSAEGFFGA